MKTVSNEIDHSLDWGKLKGLTIFPRERKRAYRDLRG
jgi:hypothetical protein